MPSCGESILSVIGDRSGSMPRAPLCSQVTVATSSSAQSGALPGPGWGPGLGAPPPRFKDQITTVTPSSRQAATAQARIAGARRSHSQVLAGRTSAWLRSAALRIWPTMRRQGRQTTRWARTAASSSALVMQPVNSAKVSSSTWLDDSGSFAGSSRLSNRWTRSSSSWREFMSSLVPAEGPDPFPLTHRAHRDGPRPGSFRSPGATPRRRAGRSSERSFSAPFSAHRRETSTGRSSRMPP